MRNLYRWMLLLYLVGIVFSSHAQRSSKISPELLELQNANRALPGTQDVAPNIPDAVTPRGTTPPAAKLPQAQIFAKPDVKNFSKDALMVYDGYVVIEAIARENTQDLLEALQALGLKNGAAYGGMVSGMMPVEAVAQMENVRSMQYARPAHRPITNIGSITSRGDKALMADMARSAFKVTGYGTKIGALSDSYDALGGAGAGVASGDLPGAANPNGYFDEVENLADAPPGGGTDEGRGMIELIHDVAPGAKLAFHTANGGQAAFAQGILNLHDAGSNIIVDDITYFAEPFFQDGVIAQAVDIVTNQGAAYFSSAGNADRDSYEDTFRPSVEATLPLEIPFGGQVFISEEDYVFHDFDAGSGVDIFQEITIASGAQAFSYSLQWDQPFASVCAGCPGAETDLDFFIAFSEDLNDIFYPISSYNINIGNDAVEAIGLSNSGAPVKAYLVIGKNLTQGPDAPDPGLMKAVQFGSATIDEYLNNKSTTIGHSNAKGSMAIGATAWFNTPQFNPNLSLPVINGFSSAGGTPILFDLEGKRLSDPLIRMKPVVTGPDGGNTTFFGSDLPFAVPGTDEPDGFPNFFGTSASAPHVAAVAALMNESAGEHLGPYRIRDLLTKTAIDMDDPFTAGFDEGFDFKTGYGFVNAKEAVASVFPLPSVTAFTLINGKTGEEIGPLGSRIELSQIEGGYINIKANVNPGNSKIGSVILELTGPENRIQTQSDKPYTLFPEESMGWKPKLGVYTLTATPYTNLSGEGDMGVPLTMQFVVTKFPIASFTLFNAKTDKEIGPLMDGDEVNLLTYPKISVRANPEFEGVIGSVAFVVNNQLAHVENVAPYFIAGDNKGNIFPWNAGPGDYQITAVPFAGPDATGMAGTPLSVDISLIREQEVTQLVLIDADTDTEIGPLSDGDVLKLEELPNINIMAKTNVKQVKSVQFKVNGSIEQIDSYRPFALGKEMGGNYYPLALEPGDYTIMATPFPRKEGLGVPGIAKTVNISVENNFAVVSFTLIDPVTDTDVRVMEDGDMTASPFNMRANVNSDIVESVAFYLDGARVNIENAAPYALGRDNNGNYLKFSLGFGDYTLMATPYSEDNLGGLAGKSATLQFTVVGSEEDPAARMIAFPNPIVSDKVTVATQSVTDPIVSYTLMNRVGQAVTSRAVKDVSHIEVDMTKYAAEIRAREQFYCK